MMMLEVEIKKALMRHFDDHQRSSGRRSLPIEARVAQIYDELNQIDLQAKVEGVSISGNSAGTVDDFNEVISSVLIHFLECSLVTEITNETKESIDAIQELVSAVAAHHVEVARPLLQDRIIPLTVVLLERIRGAACRCIGWTIKYLFENEQMNKEDLESLLDMSSQALLPRFTDKAQSVRQAAIESSHFFFHRAIGQIEEEIDDPDIRQALQWSIQHDPSVTNRVAALESLPVTLQTVDVILTRVRDVKAKVRVAAVKNLRRKLPDLHKWEAEQCAELIESGWTERCLATKAEIEAHVFDWLKSTNYDFIEFLRCLNVVEFEESCQKIMSILVNATDEFLCDHLSETELASFNRGLNESTGKLVLVNQVLEVERVFLINARLEGKFEGQRQKELLMSDILPDVPEICEMFELHASALMKAIEEEKDFDVTNRLVCVCLNLLSMVKSADIEEGSRLHLKSTLKDMLESIVMPDDLIEGCIDTLHRINRAESDFWETILSAVESLSIQNDEDGLSDNRSIRILSILCIVFEQSSSRLATSPVVESYAQYIVPAVSHANALVREAGVSCFGKLGLYTKAETVLSEFKLILLKIASDESEKLSVRAQAILGLSDWSMLFAESVTPGELEILPNFQDMISEMMDHAEISMACVAAEVASKLLLNRRIINDSWLARLLVFFFDPRIAANEECEEDAGAKEVGSSVRLQQILTQFFPLYCLRSRSAPTEFIGCVAHALEIATSKDGGKKKRGSKAFPLSKMLDFVLATCVEAEASFEEASKKDENETRNNVISSPFLLVAIQVATFLSDENLELGVTVLRQLGKSLGATELDLERESLDDLKLLVDLMERLGMSITDEACLKHFDSLNDVLDDVDFSSRLKLHDRDDEESLNQATEKVHISPSRGMLDKENAAGETSRRLEKRNSSETPSVHHARLSISSKAN